LVAYRLAFSETITVRSEVQALRDQSISFENLASLSTTLNQREKFAYSVLKNNNVKNLSIQNNLLQFLNKESTNKGFNIKGFQEPHRVIENEVNTTSYQFTIQGGFNDLIAVVYELEQNFNYGKIAHLNFEKKRDYRKRKDYLECFVIVESLVSQ